MPEGIVFSDRFHGISGSAIREIFKMIAKPDMISFAGGNPAPSALPDTAAAEIAARVLKENGKQILQYGATEGYPPFIESLTSYIAPDMGQRPYSVLPVTGSTQAMDLLCKALINPGDVILVEDPSFLGNLQCMRLYQAKLVPIESDSEGILTDMLEKAIQQYHPKMLYVIPNFQNPTGKTLGLQRRMEIAQLAAKYHVLVAEDDPYRDLRYKGTSLPTIKSFDVSGWVAFLGSFSKIISPGLRVGYIAADADIIRKCVMGKQSSDLHTANLNQAIVDRFLRDNLLPEHIRSIRSGYAAQLNTMLNMLKAFPEGTVWTEPEGGLFIWVELPESLNTLEMLSKAVERHVAYVPGTHFYANGGHLNTFRLNFSNSNITQIEQGMTALSRLIQENL